MLPQVAIIELGSQTTLLIERALRELGVRSVILDSKRAAGWIRANPLRAVILSGGAASVYEEGAPQPPKEVLSLLRQDGQPVARLGICYGMQWLAQQLGGKVEPVSGNREYGKAMLNLVGSPVFDEFFSGTPQLQQVWMSHGDSVISLPEGFTALAYSEAGTIAAMRKDNIWGVQFHPEVTHTEHGKAMLQNFLRFAGCQNDWVPSSLVDSIRENTLEQLGDGKAIIGFSGGVDSTTLTAILASVLPKRLLAITIDGGQLREGELEEIRNHAGAAGVELLVIDAQEEFAEAMSGVTDAAQKRLRFKKVYVAILVREAKRFGATHVIQGTLAPDRIESGLTGGVEIKGHHNVGNDMGDLVQLHPIGDLFKYEVRALAQEISLPESVWRRQPFPGPGLIIRVMGVPATPDKLEIVRWADARVREILERRGLYDKLAQLVVAYIGVDTVGVKGDARAYGGAIVVRGVETIDFMTARGVHLPDDVEDEISTLLTSHPKIVRVWYDSINKPPATIEYQ